MRRDLLWLAGAALLCALGWGFAAPGPGDEPHGFMDDESRCGGCHSMEKDGDDWLLDPHLFVVSVVETCRGCHPKGQIGRSHPVNVDPYAAPGLKELPPELPFQWSDEARADVMTCGTCHNPHLPRLGETRLYSRQKPFLSSGGYLTYYLRLRGATPREGFTPLCHACHPGL